MVATGKIFAAIPAMIEEVGHISKDKKNQQQGFNYRGIDDVYNAVHPLLAKYKVFPVSKILEENREERRSSSDKALLFTRLKMQYTFYCDDGSSIATEVIGEGMDSGDKASNKAMSIAYKYALFQLLCIPTMAIDPDSETHEVAAKTATTSNGKPAHKKDGTGSEQFRKAEKAQEENSGQPNDTVDPRLAKHKRWAAKGLTLVDAANTPEARSECAKKIEENLAKDNISETDARYLMQRLKDKADMESEHQKFLATGELG